MDTLQFLVTGPPNADGLQPAKVFVPVEDGYVPVACFVPPPGKYDIYAGGLMVLDPASFRVHPRSGRVYLRRLKLRHVPPGTPTPPLPTDWTPTVHVPQ